MNKTIFKDTFLKVTGQLFIIGLLSLSVSCKDDPAQLAGNGVLPDGDAISALTYDEHQLTTQSTSRTSVRTSDAVYGVLGSYNDPEFGKSKADFIVDFSLSNQPIFENLTVYVDSVINDKDTIAPQVHSFNQFVNNADWHEDKWTLDSIELVLQYQFNNWYGDMRAEHNVKIYELEGSMGGPEVKYYSDLGLGEIPFNPTPIAEKSVHVNDDIPADYRKENLWEYPDSLWSNPVYLWDIDKINTEFPYPEDATAEEKQKVDSLRAPFLEASKQTTHKWRFKLSDEFVQSFSEFKSSSELSSNAAFKSAFNGVYVTSDVPAHDIGSLAKINILTTSSSNIASRLVVHTTRIHRNMFKSQSGKVDSLGMDTTSYSYNCPINYENARINRYIHPDLESQPWLDNENEEKLYIQGMAGSYAKLELPDLTQWVDSIRDNGPGTQSNVVNNIEFYLEVANIEEVGQYPIPDRLVIFMKDDKGKLVPPRYTKIENDQKLTLDIFGGLVNGNVVGNGEKKTYSHLDDENNPVVDSIKYYFVMRPEYFNYTMRKLATMQLEQGLSDEDLLETYKKEFATEFYIGPESGTADFNRVILHSASKEVDIDNRMKMNIKYYKYTNR